MKAKVAFYRCETCGNLVGLIKNGGGELVCCGNSMAKLEANTADAASEKHVPIGSRKEGKIHVQVGSAAHPMTEKHYIEWIAVVTEDGTERISLSPSDEPRAIFCDKPNAEIYAYCNLHGLWRSSI